MTTSADWATRRAFPVGRFINTILESEVGGEEKIATKYTMGHIPEYITHELTKAAGDRPEICADWKPLADIPDPEERRRQARLNRAAEEANTDAFPGTRQALDKGWRRSFCGGALLTHVQGRSEFRYMERTYGQHNYDRA